MNRLFGPAKFLLFLLLLAFLSNVAQAQSSGGYAPDNSWIITSVEGDAKVRSLDASEMPATNGARLTEGTSVSTGSHSRMVLSRKGDSIVVSPDSSFMVGPENASATSPSILQTLGTLLFSIDPSEGPRNFQIRTPYLAAVIKGTVFSVSVTPDGSALHVAEGLVQVASLATGQIGLVAVGQTARVAATGGGGLNIDHGDGKGTGQKEGSNAGSVDDKNEKKSASTENQNSSKISGNGKAIKSNDKAGLKIKNTFDAGIGNVAVNTNGLLSLNGQDRSQNAQSNGKNTTGNKGISVNAGNSSFSKIITVNSNAGGNSKGGGNAGGNAGGNGNGNAGGNGNGNAGGNGNGNGNS